jgi:hypothetical protein
MGYRIDYTITGNVLMATLSGSCPTPGVIARDLGRQTRATAARHLIVDMRGLKDRYGRLRDLFADRDVPPRIAVLDSERNERLYVFAEIDAANRGCVLKRFEDQDAAMDWLLGK